MPEHLGRPAASSTASYLPETVDGGPVLDTLETTFRLLCAGPQPLSLNGRTVGHGLPWRRIPLHELSAILMHPSCPPEASDAAWRWLVEQARTGVDRSVIAAFGVALPGLRRAAHLLSRAYLGDAQAEVIAGFLKALRTVKLDRPRLAQRLCSAALVEARRTLRQSEPARAEVPRAMPAWAPPPAPWQHPDFVLVRAVRAGVLTAGEATLIGVTRLEDVSVTEYAQALGKGLKAVYKMRDRAEDRLVTALRDGRLVDEDAEVVAQATMTLVPDPDLYR